MWVGKFRSNDYIEHKSKADGKTLSAVEYLNKIKPYFKDIINVIYKHQKYIK